jgi:hypothetical protein
MNKTTIGFPLRTFSALFPLRFIAVGLAKKGGKCVCAVSFGCLSFSEH